MGDCAFWGFGMFMHMYMHTSMENLQKIEPPPPPKAIHPFTDFFLDIQLILFKTNCY